MPINGSLGSLAYSRVSLSVDYQYWYLQSTNNVGLFDIDIDNNDNIYAISNSTGAPPQSVVTYTFKEYDDYPYTIVNGLGYTHSVALGNGTSHTSTAITPIRLEYNQTTGNLILLNNETTREPTAFPFDVTRIGAVTIPTGNASTTTTVGKFVTAAGGLSTAVTYTDISCDSTTGATYLAGYADVVSGSDSYFFVKKYSNLTNLEQTAGNINSPQSLYAPSFNSTINYLTRSGGVMVNSSGLYACNTQDVNASTRRNFVTKLNPSPVLFGGLYNMPVIWQRQLTNTLTLEVVKLSGINEVTVTLNDTGATKYGYIVQYNSSGVLQWQRRITNVQLKDNVTDSSGNIYVLGVNTSNHLFIAKYNSSGIIQWQRVLTGQTYVAQSIKTKGTDIYICGNVGTNGFMLKLPGDGSIPGTGTYTLGTTTLVYTTGSQTETAATLTDAVGTTLPVTITDRYRNLNRLQTSNPIVRNTISLSQT